MNNITEITLKSKFSTFLKTKRVNKYILAFLEFGKYFFQHARLILKTKTRTSSMQTHFQVSLIRWMCLKLTAKAHISWERCILYMWCVSRYGTICAIWKTWKTPMEECYFTKSNTPPSVFFTFLKLYTWYQIAQTISH